MHRRLSAWYWIGGAVLALNSMRGTVQGYRRARPFGEGDRDRAYRYDIAVVDRWSSHAKFADADILELGPGPDLGTGAEMLRRGARSYLALDAFPLARTVDPSFYESYWPNMAADLHYRVLPFSRISELDQTFDLVVSNACLEHVVDIDRMFDDLAHLIRPSGRMVHQIDAQTHSGPLRSRDPLNIYRFSDTEYRNLARYPGAPNRLLVDEYVRNAQAAGFVEVEVVGRRTLKASYVEHAASKLAPRFRGRSALTHMSFFLLAHSPASGHASAMTSG